MRFIRFCIEKSYFDWTIFGLLAYVFIAPWFPSISFYIAGMLLWTTLVWGVLTGVIDAVKDYRIAMAKEKEEILEILRREER